VVAVNGEEGALRWQIMEIKREIQQRQFQKYFISQLGVSVTKSLLNRFNSLKRSPKQKGFLFLPRFI
jgi:hypothetical protein